MPRPRKWRKVCCLPEINRFGPLDSAHPNADIDSFVNLTIDEYETIRLIDLEGFTQEECANQMNVARTTVQGIYNKARKKIAEAIVNGKVILIEGGILSFAMGWVNPADRADAEGTGEEGRAGSNIQTKIGVCINKYNNNEEKAKKLKSIAKRVICRLWAEFPLIRMP